MKWLIGIFVVALSLGAMQLGEDTLTIVSNDPTASPSGFPSLEAVGDSTDINVDIRAKGFGGITYRGASHSFRQDTDDGEDYAAINGPQISAFGSGADVSFNVAPKGAGRLTVSAVNVPTISSTDTLTNKTLTAPVFSAGTASANSHPKLTSGTSLTTPEAGAIEFENKVMYFTGEAATRGVVSAEYVVRLTGTNTLTSSTSEQPLFDVSGTAGAITVPAGAYFFETAVSLSSMSATSGNLAFDLIGAGTATLSTVLYECVGIDGAADTTGTWTGSMMTSAQTPASLVTATTATTCQFVCRGTFRVTGDGTLIPSGTLVTASAAVVAVGSYFRCHLFGRGNATSVGPWS